MKKDSNKKIILIETGGTISTSADNGIRSLDESLAAAAFDKYGFERRPLPFKMLSENLGFEALAQIAKAAIKAAQESPAGIIITHGTDSLVYSAAALSFLLCKTAVPVVLVSADHPLTDKRTNGFKNMAAAVSFIRSKHSFSGVFVSFANPGERSVIHFGSRLNYSRGFDGYVSSACGKICGYFNKFSRFVLSEVKAEKGAPDFNISADVLTASNEGRVRLVLPYPGLDYAALARSQKEEGFEIVHDSYHSGTVKTDGQNNINLLKGKVFIAGGISTEEKYESVRGVKSDNIRFIDNITPAALYFKLILSLNMGQNEREEFLNANIASEFFLY